MARRVFPVAERKTRVNPPRTKAGLRQEITAALGKISPAVRAAESIDLCDRLEPQLRSAHAILFYAPLRDELDVWPLLEKSLAAGKVCALPFFDSTTQTYSARQVKNLTTDIVTGKFGVREPAAGCPPMALNELHLVLVPGMAFDLKGRRLGRGLGFYDRLLGEISGIKCGVCLDFQIVEQLPVEPHDVNVGFLATPNRCISIRR
jgi:5-formyltetrahydrofolate cyclo-ligase